MSGSLVVHLNRGSLHEVNPETDVFETTGPFDVELRNHGQAVHVHLRLDESLESAASLSESNHFVDTDDTEVVPVDVEYGGSARGELEIVGGYGDTETRVEVVVGDPDPDDPVRIDESLGRPQPREPGPALPAVLTRPGTLRVAGLAALALALAVVAVTLAPSTAVKFGAMVVLLAVGIAGYLLVE